MPDRFKGELIDFLLLFLDLPNRTDLKDDENIVPTAREGQAGLAEEMDAQESQISKLRSEERAWTANTLEKAFTFVLRKGAPTKDASKFDLLLDPAVAIERIFGSTQFQHKIRAKLPQPPLPPPEELPPSHKPSARDEQACLLGFWASAFLCIDPKNSKSYAVGVVGFQITEAGDQLEIRQTNFGLDNTAKIVPSGTARVIDGIVGFDIGYRLGRDPTAKYLASLPRPDVHGQHNFIATMLDVKFRSRLVVARPALFIPLQQIYTTWQTFPQTSDIFKVTSSFLKTHAQYSGSNFELCPTREPHWRDWEPVVNAIHSAITKLKTG